MRTSVVLLCAAVVSATPAAVHACPDAEYDEHLKNLRGLTPTVTVETPDRAALAGFFEALPPDFSCFNRLFGYSDGPAPLYSEPQLYFLFPKIESVVPLNEYARKLIGLSVNARWEADQTGALQDAARSVLDSHTQRFVEILNGLSPESERGVWAFLFGGPHPSNEPLSPGVQKQVCEASARSCAASKQVYARAVSGEHNH